MLACCMSCLLGRVAKQEEWLNKQVAAHPSDPFWQVVGLLQAQLDGLYEGYAAAIEAARAAGQEVELLSRDDMLFMNSNGEEQQQQQPSLAVAAAAAAASTAAMQGHCDVVLCVVAALHAVAVFMADVWAGVHRLSTILGVCKQLVCRHNIQPRGPGRISQTNGMPGPGLVRKCV